MNITNTHSLRLLLLACTALTAPLAPAALAETTPAADQTPQTDTVEVVVTAERRTSTLQKTPASLSVRDGKDLNERGKSSLQQMIEDVPGVSAAPNGGGGGDSPGGSVVIRGVQPDSTAGGAGSAAPTTAYYVDSVYSGLSGDYDVARVEVLRGPQGTLYGRSATSGVLSVITKDPRLDVYGADLLGETGSDGLKHVTGAFNIPVGDKLAIRVSGNSIIRDGYLSPEGGRSQSQSARLKVLYKPTQDISLLVGYTKQNQVVNSGGAVAVATGPTDYTISDSSIASKKYVTSQYWAKLDWDLGWAILTYLPAFRKWGTQGRSVIGPEIIYETAAIPKDDFITQELHLTSNTGGKLTWLVGAFYYDNQYENRTRDVWAHSGALTWDQDVNKHTRNIGIFGESTYDFSEATHLTAGLRVDHTRVETYGYYTSNNAIPVGDPFSPTWFLPEVLSTATLTKEQGRHDFDNTTFKLRLEHDLNAHNALYVTIATGFLPGDVQFTTTSAGPVSMPYDQQKLTAYELGSKNRFLDGKLTLNGDIYYYDYTGYQATVNTSGNPSSPSYAIVTAPAEMFGVEIEGRWLITPEDTIDFNYGHTDAKYKDQSADFMSYVAKSTVPNIAPDTATLGYTRGFRMGQAFMKAQIDAHYSAGHDLGSITTALIDAGYETWNHAPDLTTVNASVTWTSPDNTYSVSAYIRNIGDSIVRTTYTLSDSSITLSDPRTVGLVLQAHY